MAAAGLSVPHAHAAVAASAPVQINVASDLTSSTRSDYLPNQAPVEVHAAAAFQPAPMPDPDIDPPHGASAGGPSLAPAFFEHKAEFSGDGYASASDPDHGLDKRRTPAAGLNLSVPVK